MSGVEVIAIVSCVAGLIEALDAGVRVVKEIKKRRKAHRADGALPPSDELQRTIKDGRNNIQKLVEKGNKRFGPEFEAGDDTAQIAIYRITIQIQNVLLNRLTQARADDGVVDFAECIDLSDHGCTEALIALQQLYQRKFEDSIPRRRETVHEGRKEVETPAPVLRLKPESTSSLPQQKSRNVDLGTAESRNDDEEPVTQCASDKRSPRGLRGFFHTKGGDDQKRKLKPMPTYQRLHTAPADISNSPKTNAITPTDDSPISKRRSSVSNSSRYSSTSEQSHCNGRNRKPHTWRHDMSRASTLGPTETIESLTRTSLIETAKIAKYGGSCKYAFQIRDHGLKGNLQAQNLAMYGENWVLKCSSSKCKFGKQARNSKTREQVDNAVYSRNGVEYRWLFLAKSHCTQNVASSAFPFVCLICQLLSGDPKQYYGPDELFEHIAEHQEDSIGSVPLEGPLTFSNRGIKMDPDFDLNLPKRRGSSRRISAGRELQEREISREKDHQLEIDRHSKTSSKVSQQTDRSSQSAHTDPYANPWV